MLACRLAQDPNIRVALVEAGGPDDTPEIKMPVAFPQLFKTKYDWDRASEPEPGLANRRIYLPRGKTHWRKFCDQRHDLHPRKRSRFRWLGLLHYTPARPFQVIPLLSSLPRRAAFFRWARFKLGCAIYAHRQEIGTANMRSPKGRGGKTATP